MKKIADRAAAKKLTLAKATIKNLSLLEHVQGGMMNMNPRTDCICCKACATQAC
jgi:hypothetical protein